MKKLFPLFLVPALLLGACSKKTADNGKIIVAYVIGWDDKMPDPTFMTHINYAFGHVTETFDGIKVQNPDKLHKIVALKKENPKLKVMLSVGGWGSGRFSEMAADQANRESFAADCKRVIDEFGLDGVDLDWEYPTNSSAGISSSPDDTENFTLLMRDIRGQIGKKNLLTLASDKSAKYIDFRAIDPYMDFINIMTYDMGRSPRHHSAMYRSEMVGRWSCVESIQAHLDAGIPIGKLVFGMPFYGHGRDREPFNIPYYVNYRDIAALKDTCALTPKWDDVAKSAYMVNAQDSVVFNYEIPEAIAIKCQYIHDKGMLGAMYWDYSGDDPQGTLRKAVYNGVFPDKEPK